DGVADREKRQLLRSDERPFCRDSRLPRLARAPVPDTARGDGRGPGWNAELKLALEQQQRIGVRHRPGIGTLTPCIVETRLAAFPTQRFVILTLSVVEGAGPAVSRTGKKQVLRFAQDDKLFRLSSKQPSPATPRYRQAALSRDLRGSLFLTLCGSRPWDRPRNWCAPRTSSLSIPPGRCRATSSGGHRYRQATRW